jgi:hypothetical protein
MDGPAYDNAIRAWETARAEMLSGTVQAKDAQYVPPSLSCILLTSGQM